MTTIFNFWAFAIFALAIIISIIQRLVKDSNDYKESSLPVQLCLLAIITSLAVDCLDEWKHLNLNFGDSIWFLPIILLASALGFVFSVRKAWAIHKRRGEGERLLRSNAGWDVFCFLLFLIISLIGLISPNF
jgi:hypothetical protein